MKLYNFFLLSFLILGIAVACEKTSEDLQQDTTDQIIIDSLVASHYTVKAWDTTTINCFARGHEIVYAWECDHGNFNGSGAQIKYAAGECCLGTNTITCTVSNETGQVVRQIHIEVTSYFGGGK